MKAKAKSKLIKAWHYTKMIAVPVLSFVFPPAAPAIAIASAAETAAEAAVTARATPPAPTSAPK